MTETSMTVSSLRAALAYFPDDTPIILSSDSEGNSFGVLWEVALSKYDNDDGEGGHPVHPDDVDDYDPEDLVDVVVLWP